MNKQDYENIARCIRNSEDVIDLTDSLANLFLSGDTTFNRDKFIVDSGFDVEELEDYLLKLSNEDIVEKQLEFKL